MKKSLITRLAILLGAVLLSVSCSSPKKSMQAYYQIGPEYLYEDADGSITLRVHGEDRNQGKGNAQAEKDAVSAVLFSYIDAPNNRKIVPLVTEPNAREKHEKFFDEFFEGKHKDFTLRRYAQNEATRTEYRTQTSTTIKVDRPKLKKYLQKKGIIK